MTQNFGKRNKQTKAISNETFSVTATTTM